MAVWNDHLLRRRRCALLRCWWLIWWNSQGCIWCWCHQMHWRFSDAIDAAPDPEMVRCTGGCLIACYRAVGRASCWLKRSLPSCRADELFDRNDAGIARRQMLMILLAMLQGRTKHWRFDRCFWKDSRPCQNSMPWWCWSQGKNMISYVTDNSIGASQKSLGRVESLSAEWFDRCFRKDSKSC